MHAHACGQRCTRTHRQNLQCPHLIRALSVSGRGLAVGRPVPLRLWGRRAKEGQLGSRSAQESGGGGFSPGARSSWDMCAPKEDKTHEPRASLRRQQCRSCRKVSSGKHQLRGGKWQQCSRCRKLVSSVRAWCPVARVVLRLGFCPESDVLSGESAEAGVLL